MPIITSDFGIYLLIFNFSGYFAHHVLGSVPKCDFFLAVSMCNSSLTRAESHLSQCHGCVNIPCKVYLSYCVSGFNLREECHCDHLVSVGFYGKTVLCCLQSTCVIYSKCNKFGYILLKFLIFRVLKYNF